MLELKTHKKFEKDFERDRFSGKYDNADFEELSVVLQTLASKAPLPKKHRDHSLKGAWRDFRECHIKPDWLLVYRVDVGLNSINLARLGTHNQIFNR